MRSRLVIALVALGLTFPAFGAGKADEEALIKLDKEWGEAGADTAILARILADDLISLDSEGVTDKEGVLAAGPGPAADEPYAVGDYQVEFLDDSTAIMVHSVGGSNPHWSMHVWVKRSGGWQVVASSSTPAD